MVDVRTSAPSTTSRGDEPDPDTIKMFVGQVPRNWSEQECRDLFEKYGPVHQLNVLRDKTTQHSKGCCFVTFYHRKDAIAAQAALHNIEVLSGMHHPVQMKPADSENRNERKLFVGMISKRLSEDEVKEMFTQFGHIEDCTVLRDNDSRSKGCAFVTLSSRTCAQNAIKQMHHSITMEGCNSPIVVKFADTARDKDGKKGNESTSPSLAQQNGGILGQLGTGQAAGQLQALQALAALLQPAGGQQGNVLSLLGNAALLAQSGQLQQSQQQQMTYVQLAQAQAHAAQQAQQQPPLAVDHKMFGYAAFAGAPAQQAPGQAEIQQFLAAQQANGATSPNTANMLQLLQQQQQQQHQAPPKEASPVAALAAVQQGTMYTPLGYGGITHEQYYHALTGQQAAALTSLAAAAPSANPSIVGNGQSKGPDGSNLFIYHLPQDFGDTDLVTTFSPFGTILSAKVFIDKQTNLSKCFGFVSYDNALSAANAIQAMNGFQIGSKRLKVQLKGGKGQKPYQHPMSGITAI